MVELRVLSSSDNRAQRRCHRRKVDSGADSEGDCGGSGDAEGVAGQGARAGGRLGGNSERLRDICAQQEESVRGGGLCVLRRHFARGFNRRGRAQPC